VRPPLALLALGVAAASSLFVGPASAEGTTSALSWVRLPGSETCITTPELGARVEKHLGRAVLVSPSVAEISIEGRVETVGAGSARRFRVVVGGTRRDGTSIGAREMSSTSADCRSLDDGLVLVVALMIDPNALSPARHAEPPAAPPPATVREIVHERVVHEVTRIEQVPSSASSPPWLVDALLSATAAFARLPGVSPGASIALRAGPSRLAAFQVSLGMSPGFELTVGARAVYYTLIEGGLAYCPTVVLGRRAAVGGCAGVRLGAVRSRGQGFPSDRDVDRGLADLAVGPLFELGVAGPVFVLASATALVHMVRQQTTASNGAGPPLLLDDPGALGAEVGFGLGVHFSP
jgi:hypothetical protein